MKTQSSKTIFVVCIQLLIALFFVIGVDGASRPVRVAFHSYFADLFIPFGLYFLLALNESKWPALNPWYVKAGLVFGLCATSEMLQYFGAFALARTFDPVDFVMYSAGVLLAALIDTQVFTRFIPFWRSNS